MTLRRDPLFWAVYIGFFVSCLGYNLDHSRVDMACILVTGSGLIVYVNRAIWMMRHTYAGTPPKVQARRIVDRLMELAEAGDAKASAEYARRCYGRYQAVLEPLVMEEFARRLLQAQHAHDIEWRINRLCAESDA